MVLGSWLEQLFDKESPVKWFFRNFFCETEESLSTFAVDLTVSLADSGRAVSVGESEWFSEVITGSFRVLEQPTIIPKTDNEINIVLNVSWYLRITNKPKLRKKLTYTI